MSPRPTTKLRAERQASPECTGPEKAMAGNCYPVKFGRIRLGRTVTTALALLTAARALAPATRAGLAPGAAGKPGAGSATGATGGPGGDRRLAPGSTVHRIQGRRRRLRLCATCAEGRSGAFLSPGRGCRGGLDFDRSEPRTARHSHEGKDGPCQRPGNEGPDRANGGADRGGNPVLRRLPVTGSVTG